VVFSLILAAVVYGQTVAYQSPPNLIRVVTPPVRGVVEIKLDTGPESLACDAIQLDDRRLWQAFSCVSWATEMAHHLDADIRLVQFHGDEFKKYVALGRTVGIIPEMKTIFRRIGKPVDPQ
jgi:hypothetical protein